MRLRGRVMAVVWEQWRCVRLVLALTMWTGLIVLWLFSRPRVLAYIDWGFTDFAFALTLFSVAGFGVFLLADTNRLETLLFKPPTRQWRMPVRRGEFLTLYLLVRLFAMGLLAAVLGGGVAAMEPTPERSLLPQFSGNVMWFVALAVASLASAYAVAWNTGHLFRTNTGVLPTAIGWLLALAAVFAVFMARLLEPQFMIKWGSIITVCCVPVAVLGALRFDRRALTEYLWPARTQSRGGRYWPGRFRSPVEAQAWYDWSRYGMVMPIAVLAGLGVWLTITVCGHLWGKCLCWPHSVGNGYGDFGFALCARGWMLLGPIAFAAGLYRVSQEWHDARSNRTVYTRLMPMSRATVTSVRLASARRSIGLTGFLLGMCALGGLCIAVAAGNLGELSDLSRDWFWTCIALPCGFLSALIMAWSIYWLTFPLLLVLGWAALVFGFGLVVNIIAGQELCFQSERVLFDLLVVVPALTTFYLLPGLIERTVSRNRLPRESVAGLMAMPIAPLLFALAVRTETPGGHAGTMEPLKSFVLAVWPALAAALAALALWSAFRLPRTRVLSSNTLAVLSAAACVVLVMWHGILLASSPHPDVSFWENCVIISVCLLPPLAGLFQGAWVDRLWCR